MAEYSLQQVVASEVMKKTVITEPKWSTVEDHPNTETDIFQNQFKNSLNKDLPVKNPLDGTYCEADLNETAPPVKDQLNGTFSAVNLNKTVTIELAEKTELKVDSPVKDDLNGTSCEYNFNKTVTAEETITTKPKMDSPTGGTCEDAVNETVVIEDFPKATSKMDGPMNGTYCETTIDETVIIQDFAKTTPKMDALVNEHLNSTYSEVNLKEAVTIEGNAETRFEVNPMDATYSEANLNETVTIEEIAKIKSKTDSPVNNLLNGTTSSNSNLNDTNKEEPVESESSEITKTGDDSVLESKSNTITPPQNIEDKRMELITSEQNTSNICNSFDSLKNMVQPPVEITISSPTREKTDSTYQESFKAVLEPQNRTSDTSLSQNNVDSSEDCSHPQSSEFCVTGTSQIKKQSPPKTETDPFTKDSDIFHKEVSKPPLCESLMDIKRSKLLDPQPYSPLRSALAFAFEGLKMNSSADETFLSCNNDDQSHITEDIAMDVSSDEVFAVSEQCNKTLDLAKEEKDRVIPVLEQNKTFDLASEEENAVAPVLKQCNKTLCLATEEQLTVTSISQQCNKTVGLASEDHTAVSEKSKLDDKEEQNLPASCLDIKEVLVNNSSDKCLKNLVRISEETVLEVTDKKDSDDQDLYVKKKTPKGRRSSGVIITSNDMTMHTPTPIKQSLNRLDDVLSSEFRETSPSMFEEGAVSDYEKYLSLKLSRNKMQQKMAKLALAIRTVEGEILDLFPNKVKMSTIKKRASSGKYADQIKDLLEEEDEEPNKKTTDDKINQLERENCAFKTQIAELQKKLAAAESDKENLTKTLARFDEVLTTTTSKLAETEQAYKQEKEKYEKVRSALSLL